MQVYNYMIGSGLFLIDPSPFTLNEPSCGPITYTITLLDGFGNILSGGCVTNPSNL